MKKLVKVVTCALALLLVGATTMAQPKNNAKTQWKNAKKISKQMQKSNWKTDGSKPMETLYFDHYQAIAKENVYELIGDVYGDVTTKTLNQARQ